MGRMCEFANVRYREANLRSRLSQTGYFLPVANALRQSNLKLQEGGVVKAIAAIQEFVS